MEPLTHKQILAGLKWFTPENYEKTKIPAKPKHVGQVFFLKNGTKPAIINCKIQMANGFYESGKPRYRTEWHYVYLKHADWNAYKGGYIGKTLKSYTDIVEAKYVGEDYDQQS